MGYVTDLELGPDGHVLPQPEPRERLRFEADDEQISLCELLDRVLNKGVVVRGEIVITVADIELLYLGVELILCATETARQAGIRLPTDMTDARLLPPAPHHPPAREAGSAGHPQRAGTAPEPRTASADRAFAARPREAAEGPQEAPDGSAASDGE
ncbi:MAG: gas vesicle protein [Polyangia bacterium]